MNTIERRLPLPGLAFEGRAGRPRSQGRRLLLWILPWFFWLPATGAEFPPGPFTQAQCLECHGERDPDLVQEWRSGPHADRTDCLGCHGDRHGALPTARADSACTACHSGAVAHSYTTSKHGVLVRLGQPDWSQHSHALALQVRGQPPSSAPQSRDDELYIALNQWTEQLDFELPPLRSAPWRRLLDTARPSPEDIVEDADAPLVTGDRYRLDPRAVALLIAVLPPTEPPTAP